MKSKVHPTYKTKYRVANWPAYNQALVRRGDVTVWLTSEAIAAWTPGRSGRRGGQRRYSDLAIETALTLRLLYHLPLRQAEGFLHALFRMMRLDLSVPDHTTLSRTVQKLDRGVDGRSCITLLTDRSSATSPRAAGGTGRDHGVAVPSTAAGSGDGRAPGDSVRGGRARRTRGRRAAASPRRSGPGARGRMPRWCARSAPCRRSGSARGRGVGWG